MLDCVFVCLSFCLPACLPVCFLVYMFRLLLFVFDCFRVLVGFASVGRCVCFVLFVCMFARLLCLLCLFVCLLVLACVFAWFACVAFVV